MSGRDGVPSQLVGSFLGFGGIFDRRETGVKTGRNYIFYGECDADAAGVLPWGGGSYIADKKDEIYEPPPHGRTPAASASHSP